MWIALTALLALASDLATKWLAVRALATRPGQRIPVIDGFLDFLLRYNEGAAFSILHGYPQVVTAISIVAMAWIGYLGWKTTQHTLAGQIAVGLVLGGAAGNLHDRILYQRVTDFIHMYWGQWSWPTYNVADICICAGVGLFIYLSVVTKTIDLDGKKPSAVGGVAGVREESASGADGPASGEGQTGEER